MKREEQIQKLIDEENGIYNYGSSDYQIGVCDGVRLADKTMLDRDCEWLNKILYIHTEIEEDKDWCETNSINWVTSDYETVEEFITAFRQAMEGGME